MAFLVAVAFVGVLAAAFAGAFALACRKEARPDRVLALLYHRLVSGDEYERIEPKDEKIFAVPEHRFRLHMEHLSANGYCPIGPRALLDFLERGIALPERAVLITFDDGNESTFSRALPVLRELGFPALLFVTVDPDAGVFHYGNTPQRRVSDEEIRELDRCGVAIGSHGLTHRPLAPMTVAQLDEELGRSKNELERVLGKPIDCFGVPYNWYGKSVRDCAVRHGYRAVFTSDNGTIHAGSDPLHLRRFAVEGGYDEADFARCLTAPRIVRRRMIQLLKQIPSRLLGPKIWMPLRERVFNSALGGLLPQKVLAPLVLFLFAALLVLCGLMVFLLLR